MDSRRSTRGLILGIADVVAKSRSTHEWQALAQGVVAAALDGRVNGLHPLHRILRAVAQRSQDLAHIGDPSTVLRRFGEGGQLERLRR
eukprot:6477368-Alexandrium_andersonii.AAC.1